MANSSSGRWGSALALVLLAAACGDDDGGSDAPRNDAGDQQPDASNPGPDGGTMDSGPSTQEGGNGDADGAPRDGAPPNGDGAVEDGGSDGSDGGGPFSGACFYTPAELAASANGGAQATSAEIAAALTVAGSDVSSRRAQIVFPLACRLELTCGQEADASAPTADDQRECTDGLIGAYSEGVAMNFSEVCLDASLDAYACAAAAIDCDCLGECADLFFALEDACAAYETDGGT